MRNPIIAVLVLTMSGCAVSTSVTRSSTKTFEAKPPSCNVEFFRTQRPAEAYDEIGAIHLAGAVMHSAEDAQEALRAKACELGADAVVITDEVYQVPNVGLRVTGTAVAYRARPTAAPAAPTQTSQDVAPTASVDAGMP